MAEYIDAEGNFTEEFTAGLPDMLGEDHVGSKVMDDIPNLSMLVKRHADTKSKLGERLDNVIHKPGDDADETVKAEFTKTLLTHLGVAKEASDFGFEKPDQPEDMGYDEEKVAEYAKWCIDNNVPINIAKLYFDKHNAEQKGIFETGVEATKAALAEQEEQWQKDCDEFTDKHPGLELSKGLRAALKAIETFNKNNPDPDFLKKLRESDLYTHPENYKAWREAGIDIRSLWNWEEVGLSLLDGTFERGNAIKEGDSAETKSLKTTYNHPTSAELHR